MKPLDANDPRQLGRYRLVGQLGSGGMGRVLLGLSSDGRMVAVKQVHSTLASDRDFRSRFSREVGASRSVSGAYTAAVMDADPDAEVPWLASVFVPGPPLDAAIARAGALPVNSVRVLAAGLAAALGEIHRAGLVHRDLKPSNVLLAEDGPRVIDFGIARATETNTNLTQEGSVIGSPGFMSPEQVEGRPLTAASDIFSLGAVLAFAATGDQPFGGGSSPQLMYKIVFSEPDLTRVPPELRDLITGCLVKNAAERYAPDELLQAIGQVDPGDSWLPDPVHQMIREQKAQLRDLLSKSEAQGSNAAATMLQTSGVPAQAPPVPSPPTPPPGPGPQYGFPPTPPPGPASPYTPAPGPASPPGGFAHQGTYIQPAAQHAPGPPQPYGAPVPPPPQPGYPGGPYGHGGPPPYGPPKKSNAPLFVGIGAAALIVVIVAVVGIVLATSDDDGDGGTAGPGTAAPGGGGPAEPPVPANPTGSATLDSPTITTAKSEPATSEEWCALVNDADIQSVFGLTATEFDASGICRIRFSDGGGVFVSGAGDLNGEGEPYSVRGNSAIIGSEGPGDCQVTTALDTSGGLLDIDAQSDSDSNGSLCNSAVELARLVFDRLPNG